MAHVHTVSPPTPPHAVIGNRFEFGCCLCERTEFTPTTEFPDGWTKRRISGRDRALCPECTAWLGKGK